MNQHLQNILNIIQQDENLTAEQKSAVTKSLKDADKDLEITIFKLDRTEKVKRTTAILLEETIEELEQKRKAVEAQNRELEVESSLERVRTVAMSMNKADDMLLVCRMISEQLELLHVKDIRNVQTAIIYESKGSYLNFEYYTKHDKTFITDVDFNLHPAQFEFVHEMLKGPEEFFSKHFKGTEVPDWYAYQQTTNQFADSFLATASSLNYYWYSMGPVALGLSTYTPLNEQEIILFKRFRNVFDLAYRRFLDIEKATAQAKEAKIEAALEKVRSRSLAMHKANELGEVVLVIVEKIKELNIEMNGGITLVTFVPGSKDFLEWHANPDHSGDTLTALLTHFDHIIFNDCVEAREQGKELLAKVYTKEEKDSYITHLAQHTEYIPDEIEQWIRQQPYMGFSFAIQKHSGIFLQNYTGELFSKEDNDILVRFSRVFEQSYIRFLDLQKAEAQAREAQVEAALERVRSRTLAMQRSDELAETAAVLFRQLINLDIAPNRLYIAIIKDENGETEFWITDEDGTKVSAAFETNLNDNISFAKMLAGWKEGKKSLIIDMQGEELQQYFEYLTSINVPFKGGLAQKRRVQDVAYFSKGFIGIASPDTLPVETTLLLERFAAVFNLTYTRFNDLKIAEAHALQAEQDLIAIKEAKQKAEEALAELQVTQKQLIQSEKMASLGELTAGIAHEIQNPLNFVNNFSEVSKELIEEMVEEVNKGNNDEVIAIANDLVQNLEKINHHGKRADAIVKGMLQHSRSSSANKEPTDINKLADEYLRLAYHGLRAKDKTFNASMKTDYDETIGNINIIPQDIGRVILNLITNAFYVVNEKKKLIANSSQLIAFEPTVMVSTKKLNDKILISVKDNGNGIPPKVLDKIFQPFFTTKPTGQGTGLGLSLSYDIVKAHGGELKVVTKENEGSTFIIQISTN